MRAFDVNAANARPASDRPVQRVVVDERTGARWTVRECDASRQPGARADHYLCYDSNESRRRVWRYPADWLSLPDEQLIDLGEHP